MFYKGLLNLFLVLQNIYRVYKYQNVQFIKIDLLGGN